MRELWGSDDQTFFDLHASHILVFVFMQLHPHEGYQLQYVRPTSGEWPGSFVYVTDGTWAFCCAGWMLEVDLVHQHATDYRSVIPEWEFKLVDVPSGLEDFCAEHYFRPPAYFLHLPWERTYKFIEQFPALPPDEPEGPFWRWAV